MSKKKLTPAEKARNKKEAQARWLEKKRLEKITAPISIPTPQTDPKEKEEPKKRKPQFIFQCLLSVLITCLLIFFQAQAYSNTKTIEPLSVAISVICEISLLYLSVSIRRSFVSAFLFSSLFVYNLGVMSFSIFRDETKKTVLELSEDANEKMKRSLFEMAVKTHDLSAARKETGNATKILKLMKDISENRPQETTKTITALYKIESIGLIILRAILMLLNAVLIHRIFKDGLLLERNT